MPNKEKGEAFYAPPRDWKFDPDQQNFFSDGMDRTMTRAMKSEMHTAWTSYCQSKVDRRWWITKKARYVLGMDDPNDARNSRNRCKFLAEKGKKEHWNSETFCQKLASKKHGQDSGHVGNHVSRVGKWILRTEKRSKQKCLAEVAEHRRRIRDDDKAGSSGETKKGEAGTGDSKEVSSTGVQEAGVDDAGTVEDATFEDAWPEARCAACCPKGGGKGEKLWRKNAEGGSEPLFCRNGESAGLRRVRWAKIRQRAKTADCAKFCRYVQAAVPR